MKRPSKRVLFKPYQPNQLSLLPPSLEELIPEHHLVRVVNELVDNLEIDSLVATYEGGGTPPYHPRMMLKVLLYGYCRHIYSSRKIAAAVEENIHFMWLSGMQRPDFRTINNFRLRLRDVIEQVFCSQVELLVELGLIDLKDIFTDGTKLEANANRYTFVWKKSLDKYQKRLQEQVRAILERIDRVNEAEAQSTPKESPTIDSQLVQQKVKELNEKLAAGELSKAEAKVVKKLEKDQLPRLRKYEVQQELLKDEKGKPRNSYSKTDTDATFMRMKEDHMKNGQLKPGYNLQMTTSDQMILHYSLHQTAGDSTTYIEHMETLQANLGKVENACADAGYGSEENYEYLASKGINNYVKYNYFHKEQKRKQRNNPFLVPNLFYNETQDYYVCPMGQHLTYRYTTKRSSKTGYESTVRVYQAQRCEGCPLRGQCHRSKNNRTIQINRKLNAYRKQARDNLNSGKGLELRSRRPVDVEAVFGQIKWNRGFRRFLLRGIKKVNIEVGLLSLAHNAMKYHKNTQNRA